MTKVNSTVEIGKVSDAKLASWRKEHGKENVLTIKIIKSREVKKVVEETIEDPKTQKEVTEKVEKVITSEHSYLFYVRDPYTDDSIMYAWMSKKGRKERNEFLLAACWLGGAEEVKDDANRKLKFRAALAVGQAMDYYEAELVKD